jgi:hypothetical protein
VQPVTPEALAVFREQAASLVAELARKHPDVVSNFAKACQGNAEAARQLLASSLAQPEEQSADQEVAGIRDLSAASAEEPGQALQYFKQFVEELIEKALDEMLNTGSEHSAEDQEIAERFRAELMGAFAV